MVKETDSNVKTLASPFEQLKEESEIGIVNSFKNAMNDQLLQKSFLQMNEDVFTIPGQDMTVSFKA